jgi:nitroreductase
MEALDLLLTRESALKLDAPGPGQKDLDTIFQSAVRAPDHGRLRPWHFVVIDSDHRAAFGELLAKSVLRRMPDAPEEMLQRERAKAMRAPTIIVAAAKVQKTHKIMPFEQIGSAAAATQNIMLAASALGYGAMWKTGDAAYDPEVKAAFGLTPDDEIMGFIYVGTNVGASSPAARPDSEKFVSLWKG